MGRGQSEVLAIVLLLGVVLVSAIAVVVVGSSALTSIEDQTTVEQDRNELRTVSQNIDTAAYSGGSFSLSESSNGYEVTEGANVTISSGGAGEKTYNTGRLVRNELVYEGGMIIDDGYVISSPDFSPSTDSTMFQIPVIPYEDATRFDGTVQHGRTETPITNSASTVNISIESEYYEQWYDQLANSDLNANVTKNSSTKTVHINFDFSGDGLQQSLMLGMSDGSSFDLNEIPTIFIDSYDGTGYNRGNAIVEAKIADTGNQGGEISVDGDFYYDSDGEEPTQGNNNKVSATGVGPSPKEVETPTSTNELLLKSPGQDYSGNQDLTGGVFISTDEPLELDRSIDVTRRSILIVEDDLYITNNGELNVLESLDVHVHGSLILDEEAAVETDTPHEASRISFFVEDEIRVEGETGNNEEQRNGPEFTGLLHGTDATIDLEGAFTVYGAAVIDAVEISEDAQQQNPQHNQFNIHYDERLEGQSPYASLRINPSDRFENFEGIIYNEDNPDFENDYNEDVLVNGEAKAENVNFERIAVRDDFEIKGGVVDGDEIWVDGDAKLLDEVNMNGNPDLFVSGDATIEGGTYTNIYVMGDLEIVGNANIHGEVHVFGDLELDSEPLDSDLYVGGDTNLSSTVQGEEAHILGAVNCDGASINADLYINDETENHGCGETTDGEATPPHIPPHLFPSVELVDLPRVTDSSHYFDVRIAHLEFE